MKTRVVRISAASLVIAASASTVFPHLTSYVATSAMVNAPLISVKAPFDGIVRQPSEELAAVAPVDRPLFSLIAERTDRQAIIALVAERESLAGKRDSLLRLEASLREQARELETRRSTHISELQGWLDARIESAMARESGARIQQHHAQAILERNEKLVSSGTVSTSLLDDDRAEARAAEMDIADASAVRRSIEIEKRAIDAGVALDDAAGGFTLVTNRMDEISMRLAETRQQVAEADARLDALATQLKSLEDRLARFDVFEPTSGPHTVIWKSSPPKGTAVMTGDEVARVLDCSSRFIEVSVAERHFERIRTGSPVEVKLKGSSKWFGARVEAIRGSGVRLDSTALAAVPDRDNRGQLNVLVRLPASDLSRPGVVQAFCDVGRTADVRIKPAESGIQRRLDLVFQDLRERVRTMLSWAGEIVRTIG